MMSSLASSMSVSSSTLRLPPSTPSTSVQDHTIVPKASTKVPGKTRHRRSVSLLQRFPKDLTALVRSNSSSSHRHSFALKTRGVDAAAKSDYAERLTVQQHQVQFESELMKETPNADRKASNMSGNENANGSADRPARRLYAFFRRSPSNSRSPSRSRARQQQDASPPPPLPAQQPARDNRHKPSASYSSPPPSKPSTRSPSRPLSSTTANTHSTITSLPSPSLARTKPKHHRPSAAAALTPPVSEPAPSSHPPQQQRYSQPRAEEMKSYFTVDAFTPSPLPTQTKSSAKKRLQQFFGGTKRASFGSAQALANAMPPAVPPVQSPMSEKDKGRLGWMGPSKRNSASSHSLSPAPFPGLTPNLSPSIPQVAPHSPPIPSFFNAVPLHASRAAGQAPAATQAPSASARPSTAPGSESAVASGHAKGKSRASDQDSQLSKELGRDREGRHPRATDIIAVKKSRHGSFDFEQPTRLRPMSGSVRSASGPERHTGRRSKERDRTKGDQTTAQLHGGPHKQTPGLGTHHAGSSGGTIRTAGEGGRGGPTPPGSATGSWGRKARGWTHGTFSFERPTVSSSSIRTVDSQGTGVHTIAGSLNSNGNGHLMSRAASGQGRGRSLDLHLGLAWAATKVKEEAIMPGLSISRETNGLKRSGSERGRGGLPAVPVSVGEGRQGYVELDKSRRSRAGGRESVEDAFRRALGEDGGNRVEKYLRRFESRMLPFDELLSRVMRLLDNSQLDSEQKKELMEKFMQQVVVRNH